jgi:hypothetical protein
VAAPLHVVVETSEFIARAAETMTEEERLSLIDHLAENPKAGDIMKGTGGARKLRWAARGKGKSGGVRAITYYAGKDLPVFLLTVFGKGEKANLTKAERNDLKKILDDLAAEYKKGVRKNVESRRKHPPRRKPGS